VVPPRPAWLTLALGLNLWATLIAIPAMFCGAAAPPGLIASSAVPLVVLALACATPRETLLFGAVPLALAMAAVLSPEATHLVESPRWLALAAASLVAYLVAAARALAGTDSPITAAEPAGPRARPRFSAHALLLGYAAVGPLVLGGAVAHRMKAAQAPYGYAAAAALWSGLVVAYLLPAAGAPTRPRGAARERAALLDALPRRPGVGFYASGAFALAVMAMLVLLRYC
jgi:hypothetical protein